jgi:C-terminal processing protease CtpA/Prc
MCSKFLPVILKRFIVRVLVLSALVMLVADPAPAYTQETSRTFPETGKTVRGRFLQYWQEHGGLPQQGYPISEEMQEKSETDGKTYTVQYFERAVFELHPENNPPHDVLLSLLGNFRYKQKYSNGAFNQVPNTSDGSVLVKETGRRIGGPFLDYWKSHGGLSQQGYPISDEFEERSDLDGKTYTVQYFERAVFEYHPENQPPYTVLLSQLGTFRYRAKYSSPAPSPTTTLPTISPAALAYFNEAYDYIHENSIMRDKVDWAKLRREALALIPKAQTTADTYPAIGYVIRGLGDRHSRFLDPDEIREHTEIETMGLSVSYVNRSVSAVVPGSLAQNAGVRVGDVIEMINGEPVEAMRASDFFVKLYSGSKVDLTLTRTGEAQLILITITHEHLHPIRVPQGRRLDGNIGYINLVGNSQSSITEQYASIVQQIIRDIDQTSTCGWIVDLQANGGGRLSPMITGIGPVLGEGEAGTFVSANGDRISWSYHDGGYLYGSEVLNKVDNWYQLKQPMPPVAVLISPVTASSGEATLISFRGRPQTRSFGEPSYGVPTGNGSKTLSDGAVISLAMALEADRTGRVYAFNEKIQPDEYVRVEPSLIGKDNDPVMNKGLDWLKGLASCAR